MKTMKMSLQMVVLALMTSCTSIGTNRDLRSGNSFATYSPSQASRILVSMDDELVLEISDRATIEALWSSVRLTEFRDDVWIIMAGHFADLEYRDTENRLIAVSSIMNACNQIVQYTITEGEHQNLVGMNQAHARLVYDLIETRAPERIRQRQDAFRRVGRRFESVLFDCDDSVSSNGANKAVR